MTKYIEGAEHNFDLNDSLALRNDLIKLRDSTYSHWPSSINATLVLSHTIAWMYSVIANVWPEEWEEVKRKHESDYK